MHGLLDRILKAEMPARARRAFGEVCDELSEEAPDALRVLENGVDDATAILALPGKYRRRLRTTNMVERSIEDIGRQEKVIRIFPNKQAAWRLIGALCAERHDEWPGAGRKYLTMDEYLR